MPSFIVQLASTAVAFATLQLPLVTGAPIHIASYTTSRSPVVNDYVVGHSALAAGNVEVRHLHTLHPVMRTQSRDEYHLSAIENNLHYQSAIEDILATAEKTRLTGATNDHTVAIEKAANAALVETCTAKVIADLESVNAYHRGIMQDASNAYEEGIQSPQRHTINLIELRQARQEALSLPIHSDYDILRVAEEQCRPSVIRANFLFGDSFGNHSDTHENDLLD